MPINAGHITTFDFGQILPVFSAETIAADAWKLPDCSAFSRMMPLYVPTFGKCDLKLLSFFVPYHQVAEDYESWRANMSSWQGLTPRLRYITVLELVNMFLESNTGSSALITEVSSSVAHDLFWVASNGSYKYANFTQRGKYYYKILRMLGYQLPQGINFNNTWSATTGAKKLALYPLLCYFKAYNDWMSVSNRFNTSVLSNYLIHIKQNLALTVGDTLYYAEGQVRREMLRAMFDEVKLTFESDYFTSAWQNPNYPLTATENTSFSFEGGLNTTAENLTSGNQGVYEVLPKTGSNFVLTARAIDFLRSFDRFVRRANIAGSRDCERIYSMFGIKSDDFRTHYAHQLGKVVSIPMSVGDVTSTAETSEASLGDYAGKGIISGQFSINADCQDFGHVITLAWIAVRPMYPTGFDRSVMKSDPLDYYNGEFDGVGPQAIAVGEVCQYPGLPIGTGKQPWTTYGFTERYNEYRSPVKDRVTGDMELYPEFDRWHFARDFRADSQKSGTIVAQTPEMLYVKPFESEFNRIFQIEDGSEDKFFISFYFSGGANRPVKSLNEVANLGVGSVDVDRNGTSVQ